MKIISKNPSVIRKMGIESLSKDLGPVGMAIFIRQFDVGKGDYTKERAETLKDITIEDFEKEIK